MQRLYYKIVRAWQTGITAEREMNMKVGYAYTRTAETSYFCNYLMKQGAEEVIVDNGNHELLPDLLNRLQPGDSIYVIVLDHLSRNLDKLKEILETLHRKKILLFVNGQYIDFDNAFAQMELEKYFLDNRQAQMEIKANLDGVKALRERMKKEKAGE